jgi:hypothetical protein
MKALSLLPLLLILVSIGQNPAGSGETASVAVLSFKWSKDRQTADAAGSLLNAPAAAMIPQNKNFERNRRANAPPGERDPNSDTIDGRSAALERSVQASREPKPIEGFAYRAKVQNSGAKVVEILFWEYEFAEPTDPPTVSRRQFLCAVNIKPGKDKELKGFTTSGPTDVVSVASLSKKSESPFKERVIINRVEYSDGSIWQRKEWNFAEVRLSYHRAVGSPWVPEMCKAL